MINPQFTRFASLASLMLASTMVLGGCSSSQAIGANSDQDKDPVIRLDNCGTTVDIVRAPERVITIKSSTTELMLTLGLGNRIVGSAASDGELPPNLRGADFPVISDKVPGKEAIIGLEPDFVYAGWESNFSVDGAGERRALADLGIITYVSSAACKEPNYQPNPLTFDDVFKEIMNVGSIFNVTENATTLVTNEKAKLSAIVPNNSDLTALWYSSGSADTPYVGAGIGAPQMIMDAAGLTNIAADIKDTWSPFSWETVAERNPDVIILVDSSWGPATQKIKALETSPVTAQLKAVKNKQYLVLPFAATEAGVRNVDAVSDLTTQLTALKTGH